MNAALASDSDKSKLANEIVYLRSVLEVLRSERRDYAWLWEIRIKAIDYIVNRYDLESLAVPGQLSEYQMAQLSSSSPFLQVPSGSDVPLDSEEIRNLKQRVRTLFEFVKGRIDSR
jgi:hypothetical protein